MKGASAETYWRWRTLRLADEERERNERRNLMRFVNSQRKDDDDASHRWLEGGKRRKV